MSDLRPIGIFDSGIGGLTVANAVRHVLPNEQLIYFGDTAHLPYGDKSTASIQAYSIKICNLLLEKNCKVILIACNSASAAAYDLVKAYVGSKALVVNVIEPIVAYVGKHHAYQKVGLIGTKQTVFSNVYEKKIEGLQQGIHLSSLATPLLAPMIEEGFFNNSISEHVIAEYLKDKSLQDIQALILACTHYPLIKKQIDAYFHHQLDVIDSSIEVAQYLKEKMAEAGLLNEEKGKKSHHFFVSDYTESFKEATTIFFEEEVNLERYPLWE